MNCGEGLAAHCWIAGGLEMRRLMTSVTAWFAIGAAAFAAGSSSPWTAIAPAVLAQADGTNPFATKPKDKPANPPADGQKPAGSQNPFGTKPTTPGTTSPKPATKSKEESAAPPKPPAEVIVGSGWSVKPDP